MCDMCERNYIDEIHIEDVPCCILQTLRSIYVDICNGKISVKTFQTNDAIYHLCIFFIVIIFVHILTSKYKKSNHTPRELYTWRDT